MNSPKSGKTQAAKRSSLPMSPSESQEKIDDADESNSAQLLDRVRSDRVTSSKPEEDRRRRTIIVEKKNGSYGFTLQSYGIHYKKEQEIEMITYVDYVEYDGPAYKAGMREGDVILSINGHDMEKADHKTLVNFIKNCDTRMRMVVLFEDCVRKVELHIRYIQLQRILQSKTAELDRLCLRERELLQGKWKTHSLPARKKGGTQPDATSPVEDDLCTRPAASTEDVAKVPAQTRKLLFAYQYLDPRHQYVLQSAKNSNEYLVYQDNGSSRQAIVRNCEEKQRRLAAKGYHQANGVAAAADSGGKSRGSTKGKSHHHHAKHLCNPCMQANNNQDNTSLEAYDLASPCCDPHCVPSTKRRSRHQKQKHEHKSAKDNFKENVQSIFSRDKSREGHEYSHISSKPPQHRTHKYFSFGSNLVSQCSLHSCTSSDASHGGAVGESSGASCTTSLSSDTLYWEPSDGSRPQSTRSHSSKSKSHNSNDSYQTFNPIKPKSWDNLTTKAFGGYGFGYGYLGTTNSAKNVTLGNSSSNTMPSNSKSGQRLQGHKINFKTVKTDGRIHSVQIYHNGHHHYVPPTKSSESLLLLPKQNTILSDSSVSCDCLEIDSPSADNTVKRFFQSNSGDIIYYHRDKASQTEGKQRRSVDNTPGEVTRL
ncbi:UNVERIFIED_CONTAM: hypothetical protein PYX00_001284 [Menopon gallinae]